jgi:hypothetical protein
MKFAVSDEIGYILLACIFVFAMSHIPYAIDKQNELGYDFKYYHEAGRGNLNYIGGEYAMPYIYHPVTQYFWKPLSFLEYERAQVLWYLVAVCCWLALAYLLLKVKYGWVAVLFSFYPYWLNLTIGNVNCALTLMACNPLTAFLAVWFKPYYGAFAILGLLAYFDIKKFNSLWMIWIFSVILVALFAYATNDNLALFSSHLSEEFTRKMNLIHILPIYYLIMRKRHGFKDQIQKIPIAEA